jgi:hypothetical protein
MFTFTASTFLCRIFGGGVLSSVFSGRREFKPVWWLIEVTTRKKINRMNEISAVELALIPGTFLLPLAIVQLLNFINALENTRQAYECSHDAEDKEHILYIEQSICQNHRTGILANHVIDKDRSNRTAVDSLE